jgi:DNA-directed RNA polymerase beta subunit
MVYYKPPEDNIFEERYRQYQKLKTTAKVILENMGYNRALKKNYHETDPTNPTYCYEWVVDKQYKENIDENTQKTLLIPDIDRNVAFISGGNRWIPVFQISDIPFFRKEDKVLFHNTYNALVLDTELKFVKIKGITCPLFLLIADAEKSMETALDKLNIKYKLEYEPIENNVNIPCYDSTYLSFNIDDKNLKIKQLFKPFDSNSIYLKRFKHNIFEYLTMEEASENYHRAWNNELRIQNIISLMSLYDYSTVPNGFFDKPYTMLDLIYYVFNNDELEITNREINDISKRRVRLAEWLSYKLTEQYKNNIIHNRDKIYEKAILDVLNTDSRRILDDNVNPLGELSMMSRIIYNGRGGIPKESANSKLRNLHDSYYGIISPSDTPAGNSVGISQHIVPEAILDKGRLVHGK